MFSTLKAQRVRGEKVPSVDGKKKMDPPPTLPQLPTCTYIYLDTKAGCIQPRQSDEKKRPAQNQCKEPSPVLILDLPRGGNGPKKKTTSWGHST